MGEGGGLNCQQWICEYVVLYCDCELSVKSVISTFVDILEEDVDKVLYFSAQTFFVFLNFHTH